MINPVKIVLNLVYGDKRILALIIIINIIGSAFGLYYYWDQLMMTPWYYWLFVPDCPLYTFLLVFALLFIAMGRRYDTFNTITAVGLALYGTWTMTILPYFSEVFFSPVNATMSCALWISHCGMALESVLLLPYIKKAGFVSWITAGVWFFVLAFFNYFVWFTYEGVPMRLHPLAVMEYYAQGTAGYGALALKLNTVMYLTFAMNVVFIVGMFALSRIWDFKQLPEGKRQKEILLTYNKNNSP
jgi:uncharacterized membrane protein YpjA